MSQLKQTQNQLNRHITTCFMINTSESKSKEVKTLRKYSGLHLPQSEEQIRLTSNTNNMVIITVTQNKQMLAIFLLRYTFNSNHSLN